MTPDSPTSLLWAQPEYHLVNSLTVNGTTPEAALMQVLGAQTLWHIISMLSKDCGTYRAGSL